MVRENLGRGQLPLQINIVDLIRIITVIAHTLLSAHFLNREIQ